MERPSTAPVRGVPAPAPPEPLARHGRTSLAAVCAVTVAALAIWAAIGWNVLPHPYAHSTEPRPGTVPTGIQQPSR